MNPLISLFGLLAIYEPTPPPGSTPDESYTAPPEHGPAPDENTSPRAARVRWHVFPRIHPRVLIGYGAAFGAAMVLVAWVWAFVARGSALADWFPVAHLPADLLLGTGAGALFAVVALQLESYIPSLKRIERMFLELIDMRALRWHHALLLGLLAGVPEEILFRGAMQPVLGIVATAIIFGALHAITPVYFIYAASAGALLGLLADWRGSLWAAMAAHTTIDVIMFLALMRTWRRHHPGPSPPGTPTA